jgi:cystathionine beta-lyase
LFIKKQQKMPVFNFDEIVDRKGTNAVKTDALKERFGSEALIPLWVADMDFKTPPTITEAIIERARHGIFGYTFPGQKYYDSIINWQNKYHNWTVKQDWISFIPGVVKGIAFVVDCFTKEDDKVIIQPPVYFPFDSVPKLHQRSMVYNQLILESGQYKMDIKDLKSKIAPECKLFILCNPHNPGGRVWTKQELIEIAEICYDNNILVISDEIHSDLVLHNHKHQPFATVSEKAAMNSITLMAPSKTFNIAGLVSSFSIIPNEDLRNKFNSFLVKSELNQGDLFSYLAAQAAYETGSEWLGELKEYIWGNVCFVDNYLKNNIPQIEAIIPEASFLVWLDCRKLNLSQEQLVSLFTNDAGLALNDGVSFGQGGEGFMRMNIGTPRSVLEKALDNLMKAINKILA